MRGFREAHYVWAVGFLGEKKNLERCCMHVVRMTVPCRSGTVVACPMVWGKGESRCREQGENESWIVRCYPGAGYDGCMAGCLSVHLFFAHSPQTSSSAWDIPPDKKRKRDEYSCRRGKQRATSAEKSPPVVRQPSGGRVYRKPREEYEKELAEGAGRRRTSAQ